MKTLKIIVNSTTILVNLKLVKKNRMISFLVFLICNTFLRDSLECHPNFQCFFFVCMHKVIKYKNDNVQVVFNFRIYGF